MIVKLLTEHHLEFLSLKGGCRGSSESAHVKMPHCWKSYALAQFNECNHLGSFFLKINPYNHTVKPVQNGRSKIDKTKTLMTNGSVMMVDSIAECSNSPIPHRPRTPRLDTN